MPLVQSIDLLRHQIVNTVFRGVLDDVYEKVRGGMALSDAFGDHGDLFPRVYTASLLAGERSGNLDAILRRYVVYEKVIDTVRRRTISALIYPVILIVLAIGLVAIIVLRVVPAFSDFYASFDAELPMSTRIILGVSNFAQQQYLLVTAIAVMASAAFTAWIRRPGQRARFDHAVLAIPFIGDTARKFVTAQMARTLATLLGGGIPLVNSLEVTARSVSNHHMAKELDVVTQRVREGRRAGRIVDGAQGRTGRRAEDDRSGGVDGIAAGHAEQPRRFLRRRSGDVGRPVRDGDRAGAAGAHGVGHRGAGAGAVYAVVPVEQCGESVGRPRNVVLTFRSADK